jgi:hypothetical protein
MQTLRGHTKSLELLEPPPLELPSMTQGSATQHVRFAMPPATPGLLVVMLYAFLCGAQATQMPSSWLSVYVDTRVVARRQCGRPAKREVTREGQHKVNRGARLLSRRWRGSTELATASASRWRFPSQNLCNRELCRLGVQRLCDEGTVTRTQGEGTDERLSGEERGMQSTRCIGRHWFCAGERRQTAATSAPLLSARRAGNATAAGLLSLLSAHKGPPKCP